MKKTLLLGMAVLAAAGVANAAEPTILPEYYTMSLSRDGKWLFSDNSMEQIIYNVETKETFVFEGMSGGNGNLFATDGTMVGSSESDEAYIIKNGEILMPPTLAKQSFCILNGITSDGTRIVGTMGNPDDEKYACMYVPMYADIAADGTVGEPIVLPFPATDFLDKPIQYCSATWISDDGKVIIGQMIDDSGFFLSPIVYKQNASGEWSYNLPTKDLFNPNHVVLPEDPGEFDMAMPNPNDYMTPEQQEAYQAAYDAWVAGGYGDGYPEYEDYMDADKYVEYSEAVEAYNEAAQEFNERLSAYYDARDEIFATSPNFEQNQMCLLADGSKFLACNMYDIEDEMSWFPVSGYNPWVFDLTDGSVKKYESKYTNVLANQMLSDGTILGSTSAFDGSMTYVIIPGAEEYVSIIDYYETKNPECAEWMKKNLVAQIEVDYDPETWEPIYEEVVLTGHGVASDDFSVFSAGVMAYMLVTEYSEFSFMSYIWDKNNSSVNTIAADKQALVKIQKDGTIVVKGEVENLNVYDMAGRCLFTADKVAGNVKTGLKAGIYVVTYNNCGEKVATKVSL